MRNTIVLTGINSRAMSDGRDGIAFITPRYFPRIGGIVYVVKSIAERLIRKGKNVVVVAGEQGIRSPSVEVLGGVKVLRWPVHRLYGVPKYPWKLSKYIGKFLKNVDIVHLHSVHSVFPIAVLLNVPSDAKFIFTMHYHGSGHSLLANFLWPFWRRMVLMALSKVDIIHAVSDYEAELIRKHFGIDTVVIEHGVEERLKEVRWEPSDYLLYAGRIERYKCIERLARAVRKLQDRGLGLRLKIVGEGNYKRKLLSNLRRIGVLYEWSPFLPYEEYVEVLRRAVLVGNLSLKEAFGMTINEAHAIGVPAIVSEPWGRHFAKRPRTLIVGRYITDDDLANRIENFIVQAQGQPRPEVLTWNEVVEMYIQKLYS